MKLFISVDMKGITGLPDSTFVREMKHNYVRACQIMTGEANAAIEGVLGNGATKYFN